MPNLSHQTASTSQPASDPSEKSSEDLLQEACALINPVLEGETKSDDIEKLEVLQEFSIRVQAWKAGQSLNRTTQQYLDMVNLLKYHKSAERLGNWRRQLKGLSDMRPFWLQLAITNMSKLSPYSSKTWRPWK